MHKFKTALSLKASASPERLNYDLHKLAGTYGFIVLLLLALTGIALEIPDYVNPLIGHFSELHAPPKPLSQPADGKPRISLDQAVAVAESRFPAAKLRWIETPDGETGSYRINLRQVGEPGRRFPKTNVWIDAYQGRILAVADPAQASAGDKLIHWLHPLHSGEAFDLPGRLLVLAAGLACPLLFVTGCIRWRHKRRGKNRLSKRRKCD